MSGVSGDDGVVEGDPDNQGASMEVESVTGSEESAVQLESRSLDSPPPRPLAFEARVPRLRPSASWPRTQPKSVGSWLFCGRAHAVAPMPDPEEPGGGGSGAPSSASSDTSHGITGSSRSSSSAGGPRAPPRQRPPGAEPAASFDPLQPGSLDARNRANAASLSLQDLRSWRSEGPPERPGIWGPAELWRLATELLLDAQARALGAERAPPPGDEDGFLCLVCFELQPVERRFRISECRAGDHDCCVECAATFFRSRIQHGRVFELVCPVGAAEGGCDLPGDGKQVALASREEVERCLANDEVALAKYDRFVKSKADPSLRECPDCQHLCNPDLDDDGRPRAEMHCPECGADFCYFHAAAHRNGSCDEYEVRLAAETKNISAKFGTRNCPNCTRQTIKNGGCNHMTCQVCRCSWCWVCGERLVIRGPHGEDPVYWHYTDDNVESGCRQFAPATGDQDPDAVRHWRRERRPGPCIRRLCEPVKSLAVALLMLSGLLTVTIWLFIYGICSLVLSLLRFVVRGGYKVRGVDRPEVWQTLQASQALQPTVYFTAILGMILFLVPFAVLSLAWSIVALVLWGWLYVCSRVPLVRRLVPTTSRHHLRFIVSAPLQAVHQFGSSSLARLADVRMQEGVPP